MNRLLYIFVSVLVLAIQKAAAAGETRLILDDMSRFWGDNGYPDDLYQELVQCFNKWGEPVLKAQDASWKQFYDIYETGGVNDDTKWSGLESTTFLDSIMGKSGVYGGHSTSLGKYEVVERCNYVSNAAYYNSALRACRYDDRWNIASDLQSAVMKSFATMAVASAFFHGSMTPLGLEWDNKNGNVLIYNAYQILTKSVDDNDNFNSTIFRTATDDLEITGIVENADATAFFAINQSLALEDWKPFLMTVQTPDFQEAAAALVAFVCTATLPFSVCERVIGSVIGPALLDEEPLDFLVNQYLPEAKIVAENEDLPLPCWIGLPLVRRAMGVLMSMVWAFVFQENRIPTPCLVGPVFNTTRLGAFKSPFVDVFVSLFTSVGNPIKNAYNGKEEYPGAKFCNRDSPHALWHQLSADAVFELTVMADDFDRAMQDRKDRRKSSNRGSAIHKESNSEEEGWGSWFGSISFSFQNLRGSRGEV